MKKRKLVLLISILAFCFTFAITFLAYIPNQLAIVFQPYHSKEKLVSICHWVCLLTPRQRNIRTKKYKQGQDENNEA